MNKGLRVGIIGAGIGGVALARALQQRGIEFRLFERAAQFGEIGAGVQMTPNAAKVLAALGLQRDIERVGFLPEAMVGRDWNTADQLFRTPLRDSCAELFGAHYYHVHRADLHAILCQGISADAVRFNVRCERVEQTGVGAIAYFSDGSTYEADLIVGADGIHSAVRDSLWGSQEASFTGHMCWRALVPVENYPLPFVGPEAAFWMGPKAHVVTYYVKGGSAINIVAVAESEEWVTESWTERSSKEELMAAYEGWHQNLLNLFSLVDTEQVFKWGLFDRDPMTQWSKGRVTLLGDAAHPLLPFLSQGAAMALEDSYVLASALAHFGPENLDAALHAYEKERLPRTSRVVLESRERGRTYHLTDEAEKRRRDQEMERQQAENPNAVGIKAEWVYSYNATDCVDRFKTPAAA